MTATDTITQSWASNRSFGTWPGQSKNGIWKGRNLNGFWTHLLERNSRWMQKRFIFIDAPTLHFGSECSVWLPDRPCTTEKNESDSLKLKIGSRENWNG